MGEKYDGRHHSTWWGKGQIIASSALNYVDEDLGNDHLTAANFLVQVVAIFDSLIMHFFSWSHWVWRSVMTPWGLSQGDLHGLLDVNGVNCEYRLSQMGLYRKVSDNESGFNKIYQHYLDQDGSYAACTLISLVCLFYWISNISNIYDG